MYRYSSRICTGDSLGVAGNTVPKLIFGHIVCTFDRSINQDVFDRCNAKFGIDNISYNMRLLKCITQFNCNSKNMHCLFVGILMQLNQPRNAYRIDHFLQMRRYLSKCSKANCYERRHTVMFV